MPEGKVSVFIQEKGIANSPSDSVRISFTPKPWVSGVHEWYIFSDFNEIGFMRRILKK